MIRLVQDILFISTIVKLTFILQNPSSVKDFHHLSSCVGISTVWTGVELPAGCPVPSIQVSSKLFINIFIARRS